MNAKELDEKILKYLRKKIKFAESEFQSYLEACSTCRMASDYLIRETTGAATPGELGMKQTGSYTWYCPTCNRCVLDES